MSDQMGLNWYRFATIMEFEFDPAKSEANREKHGIDFVEAQEFWEVWGTVSLLPFRDEPRFARVQQVDGRFWTAIFTERRTKIRLISVRRARREEIEDYGRKAASRSEHDHEP